MVKAIMNGCNGRMGHVIVDIAEADNEGSLKKSNLSSSY